MPAGSCAGRGTADVFIAVGMMQWQWFCIGLGSGVLVAAPIAAAAIRRVRRLEQRARTTDRLAQLGTLTGGLAHEIKNPLSTVGLNIQLLQEDLGDLALQIAPDTPAQEQIGRIQRRFDSLSRETQRLRDILEDFLRFAGRVKLHRASVDVNALIGELADFFAPQAQASGIHLRTQLKAYPPTMSADTSLLKQALLNLIINAAQAMTEARQSGEPTGGCDELIIRTERTRSLGQEEIQIHVTDTGPGMEKDKLEKVIEPYFSSKKGGTGLGLPTARRIIEEHGGALDVHSEPGRGSVFKIAIPILRDL